MAAQHPGFPCFRCDSGRGKRGEGLIIKKKCHRGTWGNVLEGSFAEEIWLEFKNRKAAIALIGIYIIGLPINSGDGGTDM